MLGGLLAMPAVPAAAAARVLRGTVVWRERIALPPGAVVEVKLIDVSLADAPARTIAEARLSGRRGSPVRYALRFDGAAIQPRRSYALQARITDGDRLLFINTVRHPVFGGGENATTIRVDRVGASAPAIAGPAGRWLAEDIGGGGVIDRLQTVLEIAPDGAMSGSAGCNRIFGRATIQGQRIAFGGIASTRMACVPAAMNQEQKFLSALARVASWRIDAPRGKLLLMDNAGSTIVVLARM